MKRCWEEIRTIGNALATEQITPERAVAELERYFELPQTDEERAFAVFLCGLAVVALADKAYGSFDEVMADLQPPQAAE
jgi:hypothetical protein